MKRLFEISSEEKQRILEMHESATKKNYLSEQSTPRVLKIDSIKSAINTTCNPTRPSTWNASKPKWDSTTLKGVNWDTIFKESSMGSNFGIQNGFIWEFRQLPDDGYSPGPSNHYTFYNLQDGGLISSFATVSYGCSSNQWLIQYQEPSYTTDRGNMQPEWVWYSLIAPNTTQSGKGTIPEEIKIKLLNLVKSQPNINQTVFNAIKVATENRLVKTKDFSEDMVKQVKNSEVYKGLGGV